MAEGAVMAAAEDSEEEDVCFPKGAVVDREVGSDRICPHRSIGLVWRSCGNSVI